MKSFLSAMLILWSVAASASPVSTWSTGPQTRDFDFQGKDYRVSYRDLGDSQRISFSGIIWATSDHAGLSRLYATLQKQKNIELFIENSFGGDTRDYRNFSEALRSACPVGACKLTTYAKSKCASACLELAMKADHRLIAPDTTYGFHRTWTGFSSLQIVIQSKSSLVDEYANAGADRNWLLRHLDELLVPSNRCVYIGADQLMEGHFADEIDRGLRVWWSKITVFRRP